LLRLWDSLGLPRRHEIIEGFVMNKRFTDGVSDSRIRWSNSTGQRWPWNLSGELPAPSLEFRQCRFGNRRDGEPPNPWFPQVQINDGNESFMRLENIPRRHGPQDVLLPWNAAHVSGRKITVVACVLDLRSEHFHSAGRSIRNAEYDRISTESVGRPEEGDRDRLVSFSGGIAVHQPKQTDQEDADRKTLVHVTSTARSATPSARCPPKRRCARAAPAPPGWR